MSRFTLHEQPLEVPQLLASLRHPACGGYVPFEGAVRNHNEGRVVQRLEYEAFAPLALREGERILAAACGRFGLAQVRCAHRVGSLEIGAIAVWVGVGAPHRGEAFDACRYIIDHIKHSVPIWKKEYYDDGDSGWVNCENCAAAPGTQQHATATAVSVAAAAHRHQHD
jgi:molybdopterin synthase catalytic subunit